MIRFPLRLLLSSVLLAACATGGEVPGTILPGRTETGSIAGDYLQGRFAAGTNAIDRAAAAYADAAETGDEAVLVERAFAYALSSGDIEAAERYARTLIARAEGPRREEPDWRGAVEADMPLLTLAAVAFEEGDEDEALAILSRDYGSAIGGSLAFLLKGWALYEEEGLEAAAMHLREAPDGIFTGFVPLHLGLMFDLEGQEEAARAAYSAALRTDAADMALIALAGLLEREDDPEAADLYRRMSEGQGFVRRVGRLGLARLGEPLDGEADEFIRVARKTDKRLASDAEEGAALAFLNFAWAGFGQAMSEREAAARAGFDGLELYLDAPLSFAQLSAHVGTGAEGAPRYLAAAIAQVYGQDELAERQARAISPASWFYNYAAISRAEALVGMEREAEAIDSLRRYLRQDALSPEVFATLANLLQFEGRYEEAADAATQAIEAAARLSSEETRAENLWRYYFARGAGYAEAGSWPRAEDDLKRALGLAPEEPAVLNYLGYSYVERGERLDEAFDMIRRALELEPTSGAITDSLGWAHYQLGEYEEAVRLLERAVELSPGDDVITDHLGDAYWQVGRRKEAEYEWRRVLEIEELDEELEEAVRAKLRGEAPTPGALAAANLDA